MTLVYTFPMIMITTMICCYHPEEGYLSTVINIFAGKEGTGGETDILILPARYRGKTWDRFSSSFLGNKFNPENGTSFIATLCCNN